MRALAVAVGDAVQEGQLLLTLDVRGAGARRRRGRAGRAPRAHRSSRRAGSGRTCARCASVTSSASTPRARTRSRAGASAGGARRARTSRTCVDAGSFVEYGPLLYRRAGAPPLARGADRAHAGRRAGRGIGGSTATRRRAHACVVMSYDYTVLAGTQGMRNHRKKDRLFELARAPAAAGGAVRRGRRRAARATPTCRSSPASTAGRSSCSRSSSGLVPLVGIASGCCFAGNAALLGCCDVVIATEDSNIGMGGPAMIEGGGLGVLRARGGRADRRAVRQRRGRPARRPTRPRRWRWPSATCPTSRDRRRRAGTMRRPAAAARD